MFKRAPNKVLFMLFAVFILAFDQVSKWAITEKMIKPALDTPETFGFWEWLMRFGERLPYTAIEIFSFFNIVMVWNRGVSFGMLTQDSAIGSWFLVGLSLVITVWFTAWLLTSQNRVQCTAIAMVMGGAIGNAIDRIRFGGVIDFLDFHAFGWHYPAFNVADSCIVIGVLILIVYTLFFEKNFHT